MTSILLRLGLMFPCFALALFASRVNAQETQANGVQGEIIFSVGLAARPPEGRHAVKPEQEIQVCLKLNAGTYPYFQKLEEGLLGYRLILEDSADPPHVLVLSPGNRLTRMKPDANGCYPGMHRLPPYLPSGVYQVADLLLARDDQSFYSVRDALYGFSQVDELEVQNPGSDLLPPELLKVSNYPHRGQPLKVSGRQLKIQARQVFNFKDEGSGLDAKTLKVMYALSLDGNTAYYARAQCKATRPEGRFYCRLHMVRPVEEWSPRFVTLTLDSISIKDKAGNQLALQDPAEWENQAREATTTFEFVPQDRASPQPIFQLQNQALY